MDIKLIATDMDGTFLDGKGQFDMERLKALLVTLKAKDILFTVASGRALLSLETLFAEVKDQIVFLAENGSLVKFHGEVLYEETMSQDFYLATVAKLSESPYVDTNHLLMTGKEGSYVLETVAPDYLEASKPYNENIMKVASFADITDDIFKITLNFREGQVALGEAWVNEHCQGVTAMTTGYQSIDVVLDYVDKGTALEALAKKLNLTADQVLAFGDNLNDYHMMQFAGKAVAPENARPEIKALADEIIADHNTGSVMTYMEKLV